MAFGRKAKLREPLDEAALFEYAVGSLGRRMRTMADLKRLMRSRVERGETGEAKIDAVVAKLREMRYLDDEAFAAHFTRLRQENEKFGKRRVRQDLMQKGVSARIVSETLDTAYENTNEEELARRHLERKRVKQPTNDKDTARVMRLLVRAGFSVSVIYKILRNWNVSEEALAGLDDVEDTSPGSEPAE